MNIALILARSGSKRIKKKNIKKFKNKPLIYWTIKNIIKSKKFKKIIVSTDKKSIAKIAKKFGAEVPFLRPKKISDSTTGTKEVVDHAIKFLEKNDIKITNLSCFYATSIFANPKVIKKSFKLLTKKIKFVFVGKKIEVQSLRYMKMNKKNIIINTSKRINLKTQDLKNNFVQDLGQLYLASYETWKKEKNILIKNSQVLELKKWEASDIDTIDDWKLSNIIFRKF